MSLAEVQQSTGLWKLLKGWNGSFIQPGVNAGHQNSSLIFLKKIKWQPFWVPNSSQYAGWMAMTTSSRTSQTHYCSKGSWRWTPSTLQKKEGRQELKIFTKVLISPELTLHAEFSLISRFCCQKIAWVQDIVIRASALNVTWEKQQKEMQNCCLYPHRILVAAKRSPEKYYRLKLTQPLLPHSSPAFLPTQMYHLNSSSSFLQIAAISSCYFWPLLAISAVEAALPPLLLSSHSEEGMDPFRHLSFSLGFHRDRSH